MLNAIVDGASVEQVAVCGRIVQTREEECSHSTIVRGMYLPPWRLFAIAAAVLYLAPGVFFILLLSLIADEGMKKKGKRMSPA
jgi:hypothetical protein